MNGVGSARSTANRQDVYDRFTREGYCFATVIHPSAIVAPEVQIKDGVQIMAGAILQPGSRIGSNAIVNTGAIVDHDCIVGEHAHIAPGAVLSGGVHVGRERMSAPGHASFKVSPLAPPASSVRERL